MAWTWTIFLLDFFPKKAIQFMMSARFIKSDRLVTYIFLLVQEEKEVLPLVQETQVQLSAETVQEAEKGTLLN